MSDPVRVLVLYSQPLMGEGLERMLAAERGVVVYAVDIAETAPSPPRSRASPRSSSSRRVATSTRPTWSGGRTAASCSTWTSRTTNGVVLRRETFALGPDALLATIRQTVSRNEQCEGRSVADDRPRVATVPG